MPRHIHARRFGEKLRTLRIYYDLSMLELANQIGTSTSYISQVETGRIQANASFAMEVAVFFGVSVDVLLDDRRELEEG